MRGSQAIDMIGKRFGRLLVIERVDNIGLEAGWKCICDCGNELVSRGSSLRNGSTLSCGCYRNELSVQRCKSRRKYDSPEDCRRVSKVNRKVKLEGYLAEHRTPCLKCGEDRPWVIDFHHIDPSKKKAAIGTILTRGSLDDLIEELPKCVSLCRNCHMDFHHHYGATPTKPVESLTKYLGGELKLDSVTVE